MNNGNKRDWSALKQYPGDTVAEHTIWERKQKANRRRRIMDNSRRNSHR